MTIHRNAAHAATLSNTLGHMSRLTIKQLFPHLVGQQLTPDPLSVARLEERRRMIGVSTLAAEHREIAGGTMCYDGPSSWANTVIAAGIDQSNPNNKPNKATTTDIIDFYNQRNEPATVDLCPFAGEDFIASLSAAGFTIKNFLNILSTNTAPWYTDPLSDAPPLRLNDGRTISIIPLDINNEATIDRFVRVIMSGFIPPGLTEIPDSHFRAFKRSVQLPMSRPFAAIIDGTGEDGTGEIVGGGNLELHPELHTDDQTGPKGVAALFGVTILPEYRRLGLQQRLIAARLHAAARNGCQIATIQSKPGIPTLRNAIRLGFTVAYTNAIITRPSAKPPT